MLVSDNAKGDIPGGERVVGTDDATGHASRAPRQEPESYRLATMANSVFSAEIQMMIRPFFGK